MWRRLLLSMNFSINRRFVLMALAGASLAGFCVPMFAKAEAAFVVAGDWKVEVRTMTVNGLIEVEPVTEVSVVDEMHAGIPVFAPDSAGWAKGLRLLQVRAQETTTPGIFAPGSVVVKSAKLGDQPSKTFQRGTDFEIDEVWGTIGRLEGGAIEAKQPLLISYRYHPLRLDAVVADATGKLKVLKGTPLAAAPLAPEPGEGETLLGRIWLPGKVEKLTQANLFPLLEKAYPEPVGLSANTEKNLPKTLAKLRSGELVKILAWGDSVTASNYLPNREQDAWQHQFVKRLKEKYPKANIELVTEAWGGKNTAAYLAEPPGAEHNYAEKVLALKPDLVVSEFVNDARLLRKHVNERYGRLLADFQGIGAEWIILTPHYTYTEWMGFSSEREVDEDPREYVTALREFGEVNRVVIADGAARYGRLWRQGMPYSALMLNSLNHPDARGMKIFADALMAVFP